MTDYTCSAKEAVHSELQNRKSWSPSTQQPATESYPEPNPIHTILHHLYMINFNIIQHSTSRSHKRLLQVARSKCCMIYHVSPFIHYHTLLNMDRRNWDYEISLYWPNGPPAFY